MSDSKRIKLSTIKPLNSKEKIKKENVKNVKKDDQKSSSEQSSSASLREITRKLPNLTIKKTYFKKEDSDHTPSKSNTSEKPILTIFRKDKSIKKEKKEDVKIKIEPKETSSTKVFSTASKIPKQTNKEPKKKKLSDQAYSDKATGSKQKEIIACSKYKGNFRTRRVFEPASLNIKKRDEKGQKTEKNKKELISVTKSKSTEKEKQIIKKTDYGSKLDTLLQPKGHQTEPKSYSKTVRLNLPLPMNQEEDQYPEFNYTQLIKEAEKKDDQSSIFSNFSDEDENKMKKPAKKYEQKYTPSKQKKEKKKTDTQELWEGYDETDPFIDNSTPHDEVVPDDVTTEHGGFYVNTGILKFRKLETIKSESSTESDDTDIVKKLPKPKKMEKENLKGLDKKIQRRQPAKKDIHLKHEKKTELKKKDMKMKVNKKPISIKKLEQKINTVL